MNLEDNLNKFGIEMNPYNEEAEAMEKDEAEVKIGPGSLKTVARAVSFNSNTGAIKMTTRKKPVKVYYGEHPLHAEMLQAQETGQYVVARKTIYPEQAYYMLDYGNNVNREIGTAKGKARIGDFAEAINNNEFLTAPCHFLAFFGYNTPYYAGDIATGQARLMACVVTGKPIDIYVVVGVSEEDREAFDRAAMNKYDQVQMRYVGTSIEEARLMLEIPKYTGLFEMEGYSGDGKSHTMAFLHGQTKISHVLGKDRSKEGDEMNLSFREAIRSFPVEQISKSNVASVLRKPNMSDLKELKREAVGLAPARNPAELVEVKKCLSNSYRKALFIIAYEEAKKHGKGELFIGVMKGIYSGRNLTSELEKSMRKQLISIVMNKGTKSLEEITTRIAMLVGDFTVKLIRKAFNESVITMKG